MIQDVIDKWLNEVESDLVENYDKLGLRASGNWAKQLEQFSKETNKGYSIGIKGAPYTGAIKFGRRPNRNQNPEYLHKWVGWAGSTFLKKWIDDKGLNVNPYAVAYKIAREGWQVPNAHNKGGLVSNVLTPEKLNELKRALIFGKIEETRTDLVNTLKLKN